MESSLFCCIICFVVPPLLRLKIKYIKMEFNVFQYQGIIIATSPVMCGLHLMDHAIWQDLVLDYVMKSFPEINEGREIRCLLLQPCWSNLAQGDSSHSLLNHHTLQKSKDDNVTLGHFLTKVYTEEEVRQWFPDSLELWTMEIRTDITTGLDGNSLL